MHTRFEDLIAAPTELCSTTETRVHCTAKWRHLHLEAVVIVLHLCREWLAFTEVAVCIGVLSSFHDAGLDVKLGLEVELRRLRQEKLAGESAAIDTNESLTCKANDEVVLLRSRVSESWCRGIENRLGGARPLRVKKVVCRINLVFALPSQPSAPIVMSPTELPACSRRPYMEPKI